MTMEVEHLAQLVSDFNELNHAERIKLFGWFLHRQKNQDSFSADEIGTCYDRCHLARPSAIRPFLVAMIKRKPPEALLRGDRFCLEARIRQRCDEQYGQRPATIYVNQLLTSVPARIPNLAERVYMEEALICFRHKAFRASIVMCWNLAFDHLCQFVLAKHLPAFNAQLPKSFPKASIAAVTKREDFHCLKEFEVLQISASARIISGSLHKIMKEKLDRRNIAAHPSGAVISEPTAEEFVRDLIENAVLQLV